MKRASSIDIRRGRELKAKLYEAVRDDLERIEKEIDAHLNSTVLLINRVARYIMESGGKRIRPLLMVLSARLTGYDKDDHWPLSIIFEYLHTATLLHDDVVDSSDLRRGHPVANSIWGNQASILVGDFLYAISYLFASRHQDMRIIEVLADTTTTMAEGEVLSLINADNPEMTEAEYLEIIRRKTAVLLAGACQVGAILGEASPEMEDALLCYGLNLGYAFQLIDDVLDYRADPGELGKPVGGDLKEGKVTLPAIRVFENGSTQHAKELRSLLISGDASPEGFARAKEIIDAAKGLDYTVDLADEYRGRAIDCLANFPSSPTKDTLQMLAEFIVARSY